MYTNYCPTNCCLTEYYKLNHYCSYQPSNCITTYATGDLCSCHHPIKRFPQSYKKLSTMPTKSNTANESSAGKNATKLKKKTPKAKKSSNKSSVKTNQTKVNNDGYLKSDGDGRGSSIRMSLSESVVSRRTNGRSGNVVKDSDSYCNYECICKPLKSCRDKAKIDFTLLTRNGEPIKQTHRNFGNRQSAANFTSKTYNLNQDFRNPAQQQQQYYYTTDDNLQMPSNSKRVSHDSFNSQHNFNHKGFNDPQSLYMPQNMFVPRASYDSSNAKLLSRNQHDSKSSKCDACLSCQHSKTSINKCSLMSPSRSQPCQCNCRFCAKRSPTRTNPLKSAKQSFSSSKSCPQLDAISEEEAENEESQYLKNNNNHFGHTETHVVPKANVKAIATNSTKKEKSLEDSCADFLSIVCDNILESVQKSVDQKLKEFSSKSAENFNGLGEKLELSEKSVQSFCYDMIAKITEQNQNNFQQIYSLVQKLEETRTANQYPVKTNSYQDKECQCEPVLAKENEMIAKTLHLNDDNDGNEIKLTDKSTSDEYKRQECTCCHCNGETNSTHTLVLHKSHSSITLTNKVDHPRSLTIQTHNRGHNANEDNRQAGGCIDCVKNKRVYRAENVSLDFKCRPEIRTLRRRIKEETTILGLPLKYLSPTGSSPRSLFGKEERKVEPFKMNASTAEASMATKVVSMATESTAISSQKPLVKRDQNVSQKEDIKAMELLLNCPSTAVSSPRGSFEKAMSKKEETDPGHRKSILSVETSKLLSHRVTSPPRYTTFSLTPSGKTTFNCNCSTNCRDGNGSKNISTCVCKGSNTTDNKSLHVNLDCQNLYDNYDTSGYATEPEDNNESANCSSGRKRLQKKASKQHCNSQPTALVTLENISTGNRKDSCCEKRGSQTERRVAPKTNCSKSCHSSPTKLSPL